MSSKHARRISSIFSHGSDSSDKSLDSPKSPPLPPRPILSPEPSPPIVSEPGIIPPANDESLSQRPFVQSPPPLAPPQPFHSQNHEVSSPSSPMLLPLPDRRGSPIGSNLRSRSESREGSQDGNKGRSRPLSQTKFSQHRIPSEAKLARPRSWLPTFSKPEPQVHADESVSTETWLIYPETKIPYDVSPVVRFQKVQELWQDHGNTIIYLHGDETDLGPSFKLESACFASSRKLSSLIHGDFRTGRERSPTRSRDPSADRRVQSLSLLRPSSPNSAPGSPELGPATSRSSQWPRRAVSDSYDERDREFHMRVPLNLESDLTTPEPTVTSDDFELLITIRNVFAFLVGQPLVATSRYSSIYSVFLRISEFLSLYEFMNIDGSTHGEESASNFRRYLGDFKLADVRSSPERTIEALVLGERMKSFELYNEGFVHAVGKYDEIIKLQSPEFHLISEVTRQRLERAQIDLSIRLKTVRLRLKDFDFPSLFSGIAASTNSTESKVVRFKAWKLSLMAMRRHVMSFYRNRYGAWPPSARSKKNSFEESGLNRILLLELYQDFSDLYDVLVDRTALTTRSGEFDSEPISAPVESEDFAPALRRVMHEFDLSSPPVQPPIPFDIPQIPSLASTRRRYKDLEPRKQKKERTKPLEDDEINQALMQSYNRESIRATSFLEAFMSFERKQAHGKSIDEIMDNRIGQWMFMYAVLQSLPLVVIDAPGVKWTEGVEYFLCEVPKGTVPWCPDDSTRKMNWYGIAGGTGVVSLPPELVEHGVEGIYRRSHCWEVANKWVGETDAIDNMIQSYESPDDLPTPTLQLPPDLPESRCSSPSGISQRNSIYLGLEALPLPAGVTPSGVKNFASPNPQKRFEDILGQVKARAEAKKK